MAMSTIRNPDMSSFRIPTVVRSYQNKAFFRLQGIKLRSSSSDSKFDAALKELKQMLTESKDKNSKTPPPPALDETVVENLVGKLKTCQDELKAVVTKHNEVSSTFCRLLLVKCLTQTCRAGT